jgi:hypothetical protein
MSYPLVKISNSTGHNATGKVVYSSWVCSNDDYSAGAGGSWTASSRGVCLVTEITAFIDGVWAKPYKSIGTSYSQFAIVKVDGKYQVTRLVNVFEDKTPEDYVEPSEKQK